MRGSGKGVCTIDAVKKLSTSGMGLMVTVDIKNAFNTGEWGVEFGRSLRVAISSIFAVLGAVLLKWSHCATPPEWRHQHVPDDSKGVPELCARNLAYDSIFHTLLPPAIGSQCYTDDLVLYVYASTPTESLRQCSQMTFSKIRTNA